MCYFVYNLKNQNYKEIYSVGENNFYFMLFGYKKLSLIKRG